MAAFVSQLLEKLFSFGFERVEQEVRGVVGVKEEVQKLTRRLKVIEAKLEDAERRQVKDAAVKLWLDNLRDVSYDMDDVLDEWSTAVLKMEIKGDENASGSKRKVSSISPLEQFVSRRNIAGKIKELNDRLDVIDSEESKFNFTSTTSVVEKIERQMTASVIDASEVHGRDDDKKKIVDMLLRESSQGPTLRIISIVGMGGIGKTTLAQLVYNDDAMKAHFQKRIWVCVSDPFDEIRIAKAVLEDLNGKAPNLNELNSLLGRIRHSLEDKKFLLVLDDVWTEDDKHWQQLKNSLKCGSPGSKVLVTTRKEKVATVMGTTKPDMFPLGILSTEDCWSLFSQFAFFERTSEECEELKDIGWKIVDKCKGLPLAAKTLGGLLRFKRTEDQWQSVLNSEVWKLEDAEKDLFPPLLLSYYDLTPTMRRCFSYCASFPKDYVLKKDELIRLWMAQGYLKATENEEMEMIGEECFENLAMRSFFQDFKRKKGSIFSCMMHDIVHDFAQFLTKNECLVMHVSRHEEPRIDSSHEKARHLRLMNEFSIPTSIYNLKNLRSLIINSRDFVQFDLDLPKLFDQLTCLNCRRCVQFDLDLPKLFDQLKCLRALDFSLSSQRALDFSLSSHRTRELPNEVGKLLHLRYLNLQSLFELETLPEEVCELRNLQILNVDGCRGLKQLPLGLGKLIQLRSLECPFSIKYMPKGIERLTCLRKLDKFVVSDGDNDGEASALGALKSLKQLRELWITGLGRVRDVDEVKKADLVNKKHLIHLVLNFLMRLSDADSKSEQVMEAIQPPPNLEELMIQWYNNGTFIFPNWTTSLTNLKRVDISGCVNWELLPPFGKLSSLEVLRISDMPNVKRVGIEFLGIENKINKNEGPSKEDEANISSSSSVIAFPKLEKLVFVGMNNWEEWDYGMRKRMGEKEDIATANTNNIIIMPRLRYCQIRYCRELKALPDHLLHKCPPLEKLKILGCPIVEERYYKERKREDWHKISHIANIKIGFGYVQRDGHQTADYSEDSS